MNISILIYILDSTLCDTLTKSINKSNFLIESVIQNLDKPNYELSNFITQLISASFMVFSVILIYYQSKLVKKSATDQNSKMDSLIDNLKTGFEQLLKNTSDKFSETMNLQTKIHEDNFNEQKRATIINFLAEIDANIDPLIEERNKNRGRFTLDANTTNEILVKRLYEYRTIQNEIIKKIEFLKKFIIRVCIVNEEKDVFENYFNDLKFIILDKQFDHKSLLSSFQKMNDYINSLEFKINK